MAKQLIWIKRVMIVYSVIGTTNIDCFRKQGLFEKKIPLKNNLISYNDLHSTKTIKQVMNDLDFLSQNILIDSGAFSLQTHKKDLKNINIKHFFQSYARFIKKYDYEKIQGFFELDIANIIGIENMLKCREYLFEITDKIIPVWHKYLGLNEFKKMCQTYDYISFSCVRNRNVQLKDIPYFVKYAHKHDCKIHGLGQSSRRVLNIAPFDSVDSLSWFSGAKYGVLKFNGTRKLNSEWLKKNYCVTTSWEYLNDKKFQDYYFQYWYSYFKKLGRI